LGFPVERFNFCQSTPCENDATCVLDHEVEEGWRCECASGWNGPTCEDGLFYYIFLDINCQ